MNVHGIGLGLTISKKIVEQFDGEVGFESIEGEGSTFKFTLKIHNEIEKSKDEDAVVSEKNEKPGNIFEMNPEELDKQEDDENN